MSLVYDHFERAFPDSISEFAYEAIEPLRCMPAISPCGDACLRAISRARSLDELLSGGHGPHYGNYEIETIAIARIALDLCNLYIRG